MTTRTISPPTPVVPARSNAGRDLGRLVLVVLVLTIALRLPAFFVPVFNSDETFLATQAQVIRAGGDLYTEAADRKPPLVPFVYAAAFEVFDTSDLWTARLFWMSWFLFLFNLIPAFPLDGGRLLQSFLWGRSGDYRRGTIIAVYTGFVVAIGFILISFWIVDPLMLGMAI